MEHVGLQLYFTLIFNLETLQEEVAEHEVGQVVHMDEEMDFRAAFGSQPVTGLFIRYGRYKEDWRVVPVHCLKVEIFIFLMSSFWKDEGFLMLGAGF